MKYNIFLYLAKYVFTNKVSICQTAEVPWTNQNSFYWSKESYVFDGNARLKVDCLRLNAKV